MTESMWLMAFIGFIVVFVGAALFLIGQLVGGGLNWAPVVPTTEPWHPDTIKFTSGDMTFRLTEEEMAAQGKGIKECLDAYERSLRATKA